MLVLGLRFADQATQDASKGDSFVHSPARGGGSEGLEVKRQVVLDGSARLHGLDLESSTNVSQRRRAEGQRLRVVLLPSLVLGSQIEGARVLEIWRQDNGFVAGFSGELDAKVPSIQSDEDEVKVLGVEVLGGEGIETVNCVPERAGVSNVLPRQGRQACYCRRWSAMWTEGTRMSGQTGLG